ncbi:MULTISPECIES: DUF4279 domain-containing protein [unclassified Streptomyces]|uniref:DUF4279 domain-containing protein n=1 Tax=unclassified Streptomyces TaxID=2593676 RepID=UPI00331761E3
MSAFRMYVRVVSATLTPEEISDRLGAQPDEAHAVGSRRRPEHPPRAFTSWMRHATVATPAARPEDLEPVVLGWGHEFARALGQLADAGGDVSLVIVQRIDDHENTAAKGIFLGEPLIDWLSTAKSSLDIDQYVHHE